MYEKNHKRAIPNTDCIAVTVYTSDDRTVRHYAILAQDGRHVGNVANHPRSRIRSAGYHEGHGVYRHGMTTWRNLTEAAKALQAQ